MAQSDVDITIASYLALAGSTTAVLMWIAPVRDMFTSPESVYSLKSAKNIPSGFVFIASIFNCLLWSIYATSYLETMIIPLIVNLAGLLLNTSFLVCFASFSDKNKRASVRREFLGFALFSAVPISIWLRRTDRENATELVGYAAALVNILMMFGPLAAAGEVLRTRTTRGLLPLPMAMGFISSLIWVAYGVYLNAMPSIITNVLGILSSLIQFGLYAWALRAESQDSMLKSKKQH